jgi:hypothetical protein
MYIQKQNLAEIESMIPWERDLYVEQLRQHIEEQNMKMLQQKVERYGR